MSRPELIKSLKKNYPLLNKKQLTIIVDTFFECIRGALIEKKTVEIRSLEHFLLKKLQKNFPQEILDLEKLYMCQKK